MPIWWSILCLIWSCIFLTLFSLPNIYSKWWLCPDKYFSDLSMFSFSVPPRRHELLRYIHTPLSSILYSTHRMQSLKQNQNWSDQLVFCFTSWQCRLCFLRIKAKIISIIYLRLPCACPWPLLGYKHMQWRIKHIRTVVQLPALSLCTYISCAVFSTLLWTSI